MHFRMSWSTYHLLSVSVELIAHSGPDSWLNLLNSSVVVVTIVRPGAKTLDKMWQVSVGKGREVILVSVPSFMSLYSWVQFFNLLVVIVSAS